MDDSSCIVKFIEIIPIANDRNCSESSNVVLSPSHVKVCHVLNVPFPISPHFPDALKLLQQTSPIGFILFSW